MLRASQLRSHLASALFGALALTAATPALAQSSTCADGQKYFATRQSLLEQFNKTAVKNKQIDPRAACPILTKIVANSTDGVKWLEGNKDWCQVPGPVAEGFTQELDRMKDLRGKACQAAAKIAAMEKQAKEQAQKGGRGGFSGGLTGEFKVPQGAL